MSNPVSIFSRLGHEIISCEAGVYHLRSIEEPNVVHLIALLFSATPVAPDAKIQLFMQKVPDGVVPGRIQRHWGTLDARRLGESGLFAMWATYPEAALQGPHDRLEVLRPDELGVRQAVRLNTGDVVCYT